MKTAVALALLSALSVTACVDPGDAQDDSTTQADPRIATNSLLPGTIVGNTLYAAPLTGGAITNSGLEASPSGRSYLGYMIECALSTKQAVASSYLGNVYTYPGALNLATAWTSRALTTSEMRYVSACVLARSNVFGQPVQISMRGEISALASTADEAANYNVEEGAFYGNIFEGRGNATHACDGVDQVRDGDTFGDLPLRQCAQQDPNNPGYTPCGFIYDGNCADICAVNGDHYSSCGSETEVITIRLYGTAP